MQIAALSKVQCEGEPTNQLAREGEKLKECILNAVVHEFNLHSSHLTLYLGGECTFSGGFRT